MKFSFGNIAEGLAVDGSEGSGINFRMVRNRQRLPRAIGCKASELDVASTLIFRHKAEAMKNPDDFLAGESLKFWHSLPVQVQSWRSGKD